MVIEKLRKAVKFIEEWEFKTVIDVNISKNYNFVRIQLSDVGEINGFKGYIEENKENSFYAKRGRIIIDDVEVFAVFGGSKNDCPF